MVSQSIMSVHMEKAVAYRGKKQGPLRENAHHVCYCQSTRQNEHGDQLTLTAKHGFWETHLCRSIRGWCSDGGHQRNACKGVPCNRGSRQGDPCKRVVARGWCCWGFCCCPPGSRGNRRSCGADRSGRAPPTARLEDAPLLQGSLIRTSEFSSNDLLKANLESATQERTAARAVRLTVALLVAVFKILIAGEAYMAHGGQEFKQMYAVQTSSSLSDGSSRLI